MKKNAWKHVQLNFFFKHTANVRSDWPGILTQQGDWLFEPKGVGLV